MTYLRSLQSKPISIMICLTIFSLIMVVVTIGKSRSVSGTYQSNETAQVSSNIIDGAVNKDLIPDHVAYTFFLSFVATQTRNDKRAVDSYLKLHGFEGDDVKAIYARAETYRQRTEAFDSEAKQIKGDNLSRMETTTITRLNQLQQLHEATVKTLIGSLYSDLSQQGKEKMDHLLKDHIKSRINISR